MFKYEENLLTADMTALVFMMGLLENYGGKILVIS